MIPGLMSLHDRVWMDQHGYQPVSDSDAYARGRKSREHEIDSLREELRYLKWLRTQGEG